MSFRLLFCPRIEWLAAALLTLLLFFNYNILTICYTLPNMQKKKKTLNSAASVSDLKNTEQAHLSSWL